MHGMVSKWTHCFSAAVIKHHGQGNLRKSWFGLTAPEDQKSIMMKRSGRKQAWKPGKEMRVHILHHDHQDGRCDMPSLSKPIPSDVFPPV